MAGARAMPSSCARVAHQQLHLAAAEARAEELRGEIGNLVRFVEDHRVRRAEQVAEAVFLEREVGEQQMVIDDDDVGLDRLAARFDHVALAEVGAARAEAVVARRGDLRPQRMGVTQVRHFGEVAGARGAGPAFDARQRAVARAREALLPAELLQPVGAQIVRAPLEQRDARRHADGAGDQRQVLVEQLVLQRARAGGDEHAPAGEQRGHEIGEGLAGAGARLDHERRAVFQRERHPAGHRQLRTARRETRQRARQRATRAENLVEWLHQVLGAARRIGGRANLARRAQAVEAQILESILVSLDADLEIRALRPCGGWPRSRRRGNPRSCSPPRSTCSSRASCPRRSRSSNP